MAKTVGKIDKGQKLLDKYKGNVAERDDFVDLNVRGEKQRKIAEIAEVVKWLSVNEAHKSFQISKVDFEKAYGPSKKGIQYMRTYLKQFGITAPRVVAGGDMIHIWSRTPVK